MIYATAAEYNPFHNGHKYNIDEMKKLGAEGIIAIMSGNFVQRCEPAVFNKFDRAECAVKNGVDLVIELPVAYSIGSAEKFAVGCVKTADMTGVVDCFCFGSECGDISRLSGIADDLESDFFSDKLKNKMAEGKTFVRARAEAMRESGLTPPEKPNDILGTEYVKAIKKIGSKMRAVTIKRIGDYHGGSTGFASASEIRAMLFSGNIPVNDLPESTLSKYNELEKQGLAPASIKNIERAILAFYRSVPPDKLTEYYGVTEGVENRIISAALSAVSVEELYEKIKTKRYTMAGVRRMVLAPFLGIKKHDPEICCLRILAFNEKGAKILKKIKENSNLPIVTSFSKYNIVNPELNEYISEEKRAGDIFALCTPKTSTGGYDCTRKITMTESPSNW